MPDFDQIHRPRFHLVEYTVPGTHIGLGTMPAVMTAGIAVGWTGKFLKAPRVRQVLGLVLIAFGIWALLQAVGALPQSHHGHH